MVSLLEFLAKLGSMILDWIKGAAKDAEDAKNKYEKNVEDTKKDAPKSADEQTKTKELREKDPWQKDMN